MKLKTIGAVILALSTGVATAQASDRGAYVGIDAMPWKDKAVSDAKGTAARLVGGYNFSKHFGIEGQYAAGGSDKYLEPEFRGIRTRLKEREQTKVKLNHMGAFFVKGMMPVHDRVSLNAKIGVSRVNLKRDGNKDLKSGFAAGIGADFHVTKHISLGADYTRYNKDFHAYGIGGKYKF